jgi:hypothetical protein
MQNKFNPRDWETGYVHIDPRFTRGFQSSVTIYFHHKIIQVARKSHKKP